MLLLVPGQDPYGGKHNVEQFYNPEAFADPPVATSIGQTDFAPLGGGRTPVTGPPFRRMDYSLFKQFQTSESTRLEFRAEVFNLTNTPNFALPPAANLNFTDKTNFGKITYHPQQPERCQADSVRPQVLLVNPKQGRLSSAAALARFLSCKIPRRIGALQAPNLVVARTPRDPSQWPGNADS